MATNQTAQNPNASRQGSAGDPTGTSQSQQSQAPLQSRPQAVQGQPPVPQQPNNTNQPQRGTNPTVNTSNQTVVQGATAQVGGTIVLPTIVGEPRQIPRNVAEWTLIDAIDAFSGTPQSDTVAAQIMGIPLSTLVMTMEDTSKFGFDRQLRRIRSEMQAESKEREGGQVQVSSNGILGSRTSQQAQLPQNSAKRQRVGLAPKHLTSNSHQMVQFQHGLAPQPQQPMPVLPPMPVVTQQQRAQQPFQQQPTPQFLQPSLPSFYQPPPQQMQPQQMQPQPMQSQQWQPQQWQPQQQLRADSAVRPRQPIFFPPAYHAQPASVCVASGQQLGQQPSTSVYQQNQPLPHGQAQQPGLQQAMQPPMTHVGSYNGLQAQQAAGQQQPTIQQQPVASAAPSAPNPILSQQQSLVEGMQAQLQPRQPLAASTPFTNYVAPADAAQDQMLRGYQDAMAQQSRALQSQGLAGTSSSSNANMRPVRDQIRVKDVFKIQDIMRECCGGLLSARGVNLKKVLDGSSNITQLPAADFILWLSLALNFVSEVRSTVAFEAARGGNTALAAYLASEWVDWAQFQTEVFRLVEAYTVDSILAYINRCVFLVWSPAGVRSGATFMSLPAIQVMAHLVPLSAQAPRGASNRTFSRQKRGGNTKASRGGRATVGKGKFFGACFKYNDSACDQSVSLGSKCAAGWAHVCAKCGGMHRRPECSQ